MLGALRRTFGSDLLGYLLNIDQSAEQFSQAQIDAANQLLQLSLWADDQDDAHSRSFALADVAVPVDGGTRATSLRLSCGGEVYARTSDDPLTEKILRVAEELYPLLAIPCEDYDSNIAVGAWMLRSNSLRQSLEELVKDRDIVSLFPGYNGNPSTLWDFSGEHTSFIMFSNGTGSSIQLEMAPQVIVEHAWRKSVVQNRRDLESLLDFIPDSVSDLRKLGRRERISVPYIVGFFGAEIEDQHELSTDIGAIRMLDPPSVKTMIGGQSWMPGIRLLTLVSAASVGVESLSCGASSWPDRSRVSDSVDTQQEFMEKTVTCLQLSFILAQEESPVGLSACMAVSRLPVSGFGARIYNIPPYNPHGFRVDQLFFEKMMRWHVRLMETDFSAIEIGVNRIIRAIANRQDSGDSLIDTVTAWEIFFGGKTETTLRVTASLARIVHPDSPNERSILFGKLKDVYSARSALVHGGVVKKGSVDDHRRTAIEVAIKALKSIIDSPRLMEIKDAGKRAEAVLLDLT